MELTEFRYDNILPHVGTTFRIVFPERTIEMQLIRVDLLREKHTSKRLYRDSFAMIFQGPADVALQQGTYPMSHDTIGEEVRMFIVPIGKEDEGYQYEAIFT